MFNNNNPHALQQELNGLSKVMGRSDVRTTFQGDGAYTDGKVINVPAMDPNAVLSDREMAAMRGYHIHEVAHVTDTNNDMWQSKRVTKRKRAIWNAMEDVFIERKAQDKYAGARKNLQATIDTVLERENQIDADARANGNDPYEKWWESLDYAALQMARKAMGYESPALDAYVNNLPAQLKEEAQAFVDDALGCDSTEDTFELAGKVDRRIKALARKHGDDEGNGAQQPDPNGNESDDGNGEGDGEGENQTNESGGGSAGDDGDGDGKQQQPTEGTSSEERMARANNVGATIAQNHKPQVNRTIERRIALTFPSPQAYHEYIVAEMEASTLLAKAKHEQVKSFVKSVSTPSTRAEYSKFLEYLARDAKQRAYASRIARLLLAREDKRYVGGQLEGRVDRRRLAQMIAGQRNVFAHQETLRTDDTVVTIAIDASGSMDEAPTRMAAVCLNECLLRANVDYEVLAWTGYSNSIYDVNWGVVDGDGSMCPFNSNGLVELKTEAQRGNNPQVRENIANIISQRGLTPTFSAMTAVVQRMIGKSQARRIVLFATDGTPNGGRPECEEVRKVVNAATKLGIEVIGVAIGDRVSDELMSEMFGSQWVGSDANRLGETMLAQIETLLLGRSHEAA